MSGQEQKQFEFVSGSNDHHSVEQGKYGVIHNQGIISTVGLSLCIGVSIYSSYEKTAYLGHFDAESYTTGGAFDQMIKDARENIKQLGNIKIWLAVAYCYPKV